MESKQLEKAIYYIIILVGAIFIGLGFIMPLIDYFKDLFLSLGTNLISVTIVFLIFNHFKEINISNDTDKNKGTKNIAIDEIPEDLRGSLVDRSDTTNVEHPIRAYKNMEQ